MFQEIKLTTSDKHLEVQAIELTAAGNDIKLVDTYITPSSNCDAVYKSSISKPLEFGDCIVVADFNAHSALYGTQNYWKEQEETFLQMK